MLDEIDEEHADMLVPQNVAEARQDAVAAVLRIYQGPLIETLHEAARTRTERAIALPAGVSGRDKHELALCNEVPHWSVQIIEHLLVVEGKRPAARAKHGLGLVLTCRTRLPHRDVSTIHLVTINCLGRRVRSRTSEWRAARSVEFGGNRPVVRAPGARRPPHDTCRVCFPASRGGAQPMTLWETAWRSTLFRRFAWM